jgi:hypothetical protein
MMPREDVERLLDLGKADAFDRVTEEVLDAAVVAIGIKFEQPSADIVGLRTAAELRLVSLFRLRAAPGSPDQVEGHVFDGGEVGWCVIGADAALVVAESHIHDPVQAVLDHPMGSDGRPELGGGDHGRIETRTYTVIHDVAWRRRFYVG